LRVEQMSGSFDVTGDVSGAPARCAPSMLEHPENGL